MALSFTKNITAKTNPAEFLLHQNLKKTWLVLNFAKNFGDSKDKRPKYIPESTNEEENPNNTQKDESKPLEMPEEPTIPCCMTGCANCVWIEYAEALERYFKDGGAKAVKEINEKIKDPNIKAYLLTELRIKKMNS